MEVHRRSSKHSKLAPGARVSTRDEQFVVRRLERTLNNRFVVTLTGLSRLVRDKDYYVLDTVEDYTVVNPHDTKIVHDESPRYRASRLHIESVLRQTPPTDTFIRLGHRGAMDSVPYQLVPALMALQQPKPRILIADAVGIGKTLEAGILMTELIRRGRGRRILVVTLKSMLTQFQKELWSRFTIPLVRLDSVGIQRVRARLPTNHNPFYYYDRAIISIDTLKAARQYRSFIENAYWDIIVLDEAQHVAERPGRSLRNKLAKLLADRSDALIMLSATPHDGRAKSFASLVNMLDPTAIADPNSYTKEDLDGKNLFIRRFKKDIWHQVSGAFQERSVTLRRAQASVQEEEAFRHLTDMSGTIFTARRGGQWLIRTVLEKAVFSSPAACRETISNRIDRLRKAATARDDEIYALQQLDSALGQVTVEHFSKYRLLLNTIKEMGWTGKNEEDRLVIFTERIDTLQFLSENLEKDLGLKPKAIVMLHGALSDLDQQAIVESFGQTDKPVRLLIASDVGSEGINLHFLSHRLIHFDIPWSLMILQQRNGRVDRYGQEKKPQIYYLITESENRRIRGDMRILELLIEKEEEAVRNIGDPASIIGVYNAEQEEIIVKDVIEQGMTTDQAERHFRTQRADPSVAAGIDPIQALFGELDPMDDAANSKRELHSVFDSDYAYLKTALEHIQAETQPGDEEKLQVSYYDDEMRLQLTAPTGLKDRFKYLPKAARPRKDILDVCADRQTIKDEIRRCRSDDDAWPAIHYLWPLHPAMRWATDKVTSSIKEQEAFILALPDVLHKTEASYVISVLYSNRRGQTVLQKLICIRTGHGKHLSTKLFAKSKEFHALRRTGLSNAGIPDILEHAQGLLPAVLNWAAEYGKDARAEHEAIVGPKLQEHLDDLKTLRERHNAVVRQQFEGREDRLATGTIAKRSKEIDKLFTNYEGWITDTMELEDDPYLQVLAVLTGLGTD